MNKAADFFVETNLYQTEQIRTLEKLADERYQLTPLTLMERAGMAVFKVLRETWRDKKRIAVVCGKGNNGGDGYVLARLLHKANLAVTAFWIVDPEKSLTGTASEAYVATKKAHVKIEPFAEEKLANFDVVVDAIFGIGLNSEVKEPYREAILAINRAGLPVLAIDVPSGLNADSGVILGTAIAATLTVTLIGLKTGLFTYQGTEVAGEVKLDQLSLPDEIFAEANIKPSAKLLDIPVLESFLPKRKSYANKGDFGRVLVVGGDLGMPGAARLAGESALRVGAGLVTVATRPEHIAIICAARPELMCFGINVNNGNAIRELLAKATVVAIGPGLGKKYFFGRKLWKETKKTKQPLVVDADALNMLAQRKLKRDNWILTPHPGEAARLLHLKKAQDIQQDRFAAVRAIQKKYGGIVILKGVGTLICDDEGQVYVCPYGNPGMAKAGMGDVLTGVLAGLVAQGLSLKQAALWGTVLHAKAADQAVLKIGERALLALDVLPLFYQGAM